ncbi:hypothetical protein A2230_04200 [candidate division WOR-1 bacterium RIFOXYA2_FULL_36_21]|uniref:Uncharacterized protein n=1 Tax=candidate division WOR-1 bacterium RIFOXYB2_FULL_36_35 TaxID=1802578 RepID=A0A1F4RY75_UNCSA|nr:MAG: hypothetical protein A2230_04200 [candidate division WOR-1 bacterium RIFOXYA2_FULL_36_21]OGC13146.1 MAG: hypothetical protein A2290_07545 [candidate division WOR-1 bacterium RIFOXYB2_FULL_36_35]OGC16918.1 MAG: hypothetical protein A2282_05700 [candidate division WOR-1 bacterium RIFOXYA12_FULL_36_13]
MITANPIGLILTGTCRGSINTLSYGIAKLRRLVENETSLLSAEHFIELSKLINSLKTVERKLVDFFVSASVPAIITGVIDSENFSKILEYAGDKIGEMIIKKITAEVKIICDYDLLSKAYEFSVGQKEFDDTLLDAVIERAKELFVFQNLDSKEDTSLFKAVIDDYMQELDIEGKSIEELEFSDPSLLLDEVSGYSTQALLKTLVAKFPKLDFFSDN